MCAAYMRRTPASAPSATAWIIRLDPMVSHQTRKKGFAPVKRTPSRIPDLLFDPCEISPVGVRSLFEAACRSCRTAKPMSTIPLGIPMILAVEGVKKVDKPIARPRTKGASTIVCPIELCTPAIQPSFVARRVEDTNRGPGPKTPEMLRMTTVARNSRVIDNQSPTYCASSLLRRNFNPIVVRLSC